LPYTLRSGRVFADGPWPREREQPLKTKPPEFSDVIVEEYAPDDRDGCLEVFRTNLPVFFTPEEAEMYASFLDALPGPYLVVRDPDHRIVACGGYAVQESGTVADMCWGMVQRDLHGLGIGNVLTRARVERIRNDGSVREISLNTSQHTVGFYEKLGFEVVEVLADGYAPGLDRYDMRLVLAEGGR
jgi:ribosomal protein S18 acetylase RimI-like enzyme